MTMKGSGALHGTVLQDFLPVLAAGNEGAAMANASGVSTVTSPATAKNCITAGATEVAGQSFITNPQYITASMTLHQPTSTASNDVAVDSYQVSVCHPVFP